MGAWGIGHWENDAALDALTCENAVEHCVLRMESFLRRPEKFASSAWRIQEVMAGIGLIEAVNFPEKTTEEFLDQLGLREESTRQLLNAEFRTTAVDALKVLQDRTTALHDEWQDAGLLSDWCAKLERTLQKLLKIDSTENC